MGLTVNTNIASLIAQKNVSKSSNALSKIYERLSTGSRINRAADDAAGLAISNTLQSHIRSINQAVRNSNDAVSLTQVAEGGLNEMSNIMGRMRELAMQASNETLSSDARSALNSEYVALKEEVDRISDTTAFGDKKILDGSMADGVNFQVGIKNGPEDSMTFAMADTDAESLGLNTGGAENLESAESARSALGVIDDQAMSTLSSRRGDLGVVQNRLEYTVSNLQAKSDNLAAANSRIRDADFALETALSIKTQILNQSGLSVLAQANVSPKQALALLK